MKIRGFRRRSLISTYIALGVIGSLGVLAAIGCGTASNTYSPTVAGNKAAVTDFSIAVTPASVSVVPGATAHYTVNLTSINGFASNVALTASGLPSGASATFGTPTATETGATATLDISTTANNVEESAAKVGGTSAKISRTTPLGSTNFTVTGTGGGKTHSTTATLVVGQNPDFTIAVTPATLNVPNFTTAQYTITLTALGNFDLSTVTLAAPTGLLSNTAATYGAPTTTATTKTIPLSIRTSIDDNTPDANSTFTVSGSGSGVTHSATAGMNVTDFSVVITPASQSTVFVGSTLTYTVTVTSLNGYNLPVTLSNVGLPITGTTVTLGITTITPTAAGATTTLSVTNSGTTPLGTYVLRVEGANGTPGINFVNHDGGATYILQPG